MLARYGTTLAFAILAVIAILFLISGHWFIAILFAIAAGGAWLVRSVRRERGR